MSLIFLNQSSIYLRDLLRELVVRDIKLRYKRSVLGIAWSLLNPLAQLVVFSVVFSFLLPLNIPNYTAFLFTGLLAWNWFQTSLFSAATTIVDGRSLIKRPGFPAAILPIVTVTANYIHFLLALPVLLIFLLITGITLTPFALLLPLVMVLQFIFTLSLCYIIAAVHVTFRDTQHLIGVLTFLLFYLTPIFYDQSIVPAQLLWVFRLNPILHLLEAYRDILIRGQWPNVGPLLAISLLSLGLLWAGYRFFQRASLTFVEEL